MICSVPRNSPMADYQNIWLTDKHSEPIGTIRTLGYGPTQKRPPSVQAVFKLLQPQSPRGFSALARLYYLARPTKTAMLRRLHGNWFSSLELDASGARSPWRSEEELRKSKIKMPCDKKKKNVNLHFWRLTVKNISFNGWRLQFRPFDGWHLTPLIPS